ncbi:MAG: NAD(P)/FAD-dependent oxidoreductase [Puniceicoccales bacterium]|jgi:phytoene dehydrogenase-like protein|nr:NAD(P)/FAD-dependent oxidoreductase [Puniceicoccales bacterium]
MDSRLGKLKSSYDAVIIGSGLGGLTAANYLGKLGHSVLLLEQHYQLGGLAAWFKRPGGHIFDISLHGFPVGMIKSCRKYWSPAIADAIVQLPHIRFVNPQFSLETSFTRQDFSRLLIEDFHIPSPTVESFFEQLRQMNFYDHPTESIREFFEKFFPQRDDVHRFLLEPIAYANGSTLDDPAISYGVVFSNFMSQGVYTFRGGTDHLIGAMMQELLAHGVDIRLRCPVKEILLEASSPTPSVSGVRVGDTSIPCRAVISNANILKTLTDYLPSSALGEDLKEQSQQVRINTSSCQVYLGIRSGESIPDIGDLIFFSENEHFEGRELLDFHTKSRTFSLYYPGIRPQREPHYTIVASMNTRWEDWNALDAVSYKKEKGRIIEDTLRALEILIPDIRSKIDWAEAATPKTFQRYTGHPRGTSFGTKFEGLDLSMRLSDHIHGLYHTGSVGIIMSGWLGAMNYGVISAHKVASMLHR